MLKKQSPGKPIEFFCDVTWWLTDKYLASFLEGFSVFYRRNFKNIFVYIKTRRIVFIVKHVHVGWSAQI